MTASAGWLIHYYETVTSTMDHAALLANMGARERTVVVSEEQTAGRGRGGRAWQSGRGLAVSCTLILRPQVPVDRLATLSMMAGVAVAEAVEAVSGMPARLKWPNDVWLGDDPDHQKVAGILLTSSLSGTNVAFVLVGIGINVTTPRSELPPGGASLLSATGVAFDLNHVRDLLLERVDAGYEAYLAARGRPALDGWRARAALMGEPVTIEDAGRQFRGVYTGIDDDGALLLATPDGGERRVVAGDLARGPRRAS